MAWRALTAADSAFTPAELNTLRGMDGTLTKLTDRLASQVKRWIGAMNAAGYQVIQDGTVPDQLRDEIIDGAVWRWLKDFPQLKTMQTDARKVAAAQSTSAFLKVVDRTYGSIESPFGTDVTTGNWNSSVKLIGRMGVVPVPTAQMSPNPNPLYANINAPTDSVTANVPATPGAPLGLTAQPLNGAVFLEWDAVAGAATYTLYRGTVSKQEVLLVANLAVSYYLDQAVANSTQYFYYVKAVNAAATSPASLEVTALPQATIPP